MYLNYFSIMKHNKISICTLIAVAICSQTLAQGNRNEVFPEGSKAPVTNIDRNSYPRILKDNSVMFCINAQSAQNIQIDLGGKKYDMVRSENGIWNATTQPQVPGFHYYSVIIDGVSVADPASESFYGCSRMSSAIEIPEDGTDFEVKDVPHGEVRTIYYFSKIENEWRPLNIYTPAGYNESTSKYPDVY